MDGPVAAQSGEIAGRQDAGAPSGLSTIPRQHAAREMSEPQTGMRGMPTVMILQQGQVAATKVGALPKLKIKEWIDASN